MTVKVKLGVIYQQNPAFDVLLKSKLPAKIAYQMAKMTKQIAEEVQIVEKHRLELIEKFGEEFTPEGATEPSKKVKEENIQAFITEFNEMLNQEVELYGEPIDIDSIPHVEISAEQLLTIDWLIKQ